VPFQFDGVPGISFPGIAPGQTFDYRFVRQAGTYWYHSHSGMQEAMGLLGPIVIDPAGPEPSRMTASIRSCCTTGATCIRMSC
jgi:FtsP/CotA-like multicopper oxidase with cupredoxin domain